MKAYLHIQCAGAPERAHCGDRIRFGDLTSLTEGEYAARGEHARGAVCRGCRLNVQHTHADDRVAA